MRSVFDQQGEGWLPDSPQANQAQDAAARKMGYNNAAEARAAGKTLPTTAEDVAKFWGQTQGANSWNSGAQASGSTQPAPASGNPWNNLPAWDEPRRAPVSRKPAPAPAPRPASAPQQPAPRPTQAPAPASRTASAPQDQKIPLSNSEKSTLQQRAAGGDPNAQRALKLGNLTAQEHKSIFGTPAPQNRSTTQSQDPGFLNMPTPRISSTPAPSSSSGTQFRVIDGILRPMGTPNNTGNKSVFDKQGEGWHPDSPEGKEVLKGMR